MAWDIEGTKRSLLEAGTGEFATHGLAGARVDRIASAAGISKERIYQYFGNKQALFSAVLNKELSTSLTAVAITGHGPSALADYARRRFDYQRANPSLTRLLFWEGLEREPFHADESRREHARNLVGEARAAVPELSEADAQEILITIITLVDGWVALQATDRQIAGLPSDENARAERRREFIVEAVRSVTSTLVGRKPR
ncbi:MULTISPECIES: TetR/AcrR family transcriptional regulator [Nocardiaceae]|uniref:TetR/AcrR family transcriptional regulator n=1 Tax=Nocardiaceae TaxID=85025 RepID=UPI00055F4A6B|nr:MULTISPECIES: TetR family transcriptional regulator [Rhodococcus]OZE95447.1 TetR family transcriptional regulator [Rhodococcus sp. 15-1189-1-1a]OZF10077.1 TetR family transcriptional regulator [Rhodococcus sp. 14-2686-1-2]OZF44943.1 TetR family transcriptional regulator [Rhodococcus sp. 14-2470-1b]